MASLAKEAIFIVGAKRTPFGAFGGKLKNLSATDLAVHSSKAALAQAGLSGSKVDETFVGNVTQSSLDAAYLARHVALRSGVPVKSPAMTINRLCGSGFETICLGTEAIIQKRASISLCVGTESMSQAPMVIDGLTARWGAQLGKGMIAEDSLWAGLTDTYAKMSMGLTAEKLGEQYKITREQCDEFGLRSQTLWQKANDAGVFNAEIAPLELKGRKGPDVMTTDEHPRKDSKIADLTKLKPVFKPEGGLVTAATASGICDGAGSLIIASESAVKDNNLKPLARVIAWSRTGCDPSIMGIGPVEAIKTTLAIANLKISDMDVVEINEAFAAQFLSCAKELNLDLNKTNVSGGAIALGHPLGASGSRIMANLTHELVRTKKRYAIGSACIGGGQGIAVLIENATL